MTLSFVTFKHRSRRAGSSLRRAWRRRTPKESALMAPDVLATPCSPSSSSSPAAAPVPFPLVSSAATLSPSVSSAASASSSSMAWEEVLASEANIRFRLATALSAIVGFRSISPPSSTIDPPGPTTLSEPAPERWALPFCAEAGSSSPSPVEGSTTACPGKLAALERSTRSKTGFTRDPRATKSDRPDPLPSRMAACMLSRPGMAAVLVPSTCTRATREASTEWGFLAEEVRQSQT
mmetsp:Transcript_32128/g.91119  ORF Transcript_32128/g.91119 Transcript_32128/m.91119 type:complete len:236 (+) Transcript_32128:1154-1861(+)